MCATGASKEASNSPARCRIIPFSLGRTKPTAILLVTHFQDANPDTCFCRCAAILLLWFYPATDIERNWKAPRKISLRPVPLSLPLSPKGRGDCSVQTLFPQPTGRGREAGIKKPGIRPVFKFNGQLSEPLPACASPHSGNRTSVRSSPDPAPPLPGRRPPANQTAAR